MRPLTRLELISSKISPTLEEDLEDEDSVGVVYDDDMYIVKGETIGTNSALMRDVALFSNDTTVYVDDNEDSSDKKLGKFYQDNTKFIKDLRTVSLGLHFFKK